MAKLHHNAAIITTDITTVSGIKDNKVLTDEVVVVVWTLLANSAPMPDSTCRIIFYHHQQYTSTTNLNILPLYFLNSHRVKAQQQQSAEISNNNKMISCPKRHHLRCYYYTPCPEKKGTNSILGITSSNTDRFSKFFQRCNLLEICNKTLIKFPTTPQTRRYTTLLHSCEKLMSEN